MSARSPLPTYNSARALPVVPPPPPPHPLAHPLHHSTPLGTGSPGRAPSSFIANTPLHAQHLQSEHRWSPVSSPNIASPPGASPASYLRGPGPVNSPSSPFGSALSPLAQSVSPNSTSMATRAPVVEYNPQRWGHNAATGGAYIPHAAVPPGTARGNPEDGDPNPPPPYSPPPGSQFSPNTPPPSSIASRPTHTSLPQLHTSTPTPTSSIGEFASPLSAISAVTVVPFGMHDRNRQNIRAISSPLNPGPGGAPSFPPPPGRDRTPSRSRTENSTSRFGLSALIRGRSSDRSLPSAQDVTPQTAINTSLQPLVPRHNMPLTHNSPPAYVPQQRSVNPPQNRATVYMPASHPVPEPPNARRSASTGAISHHQPGTQVFSQSGIVLPPPPPGPPPSGSRSASVDPNYGHSRNGSIEVGNIMVPILSMPTRRANRRGTFTVLDTVPPTPANWDENSPNYEAPRPSYQRDSSQSDASYDPSEPSSSENIPGQSAPARDRSVAADGLRRDTTVKGIRERRSESRAARDRVLDDQAKPADLILASPASISRQGAVKKTRSPQEAKHPSKQSLRSRRLGTDQTSTPPFSPGRESLDIALRSIDPSIPPKALPTPPPQSSGGKGKMRSLEISAPSRGEVGHESFAKSSLQRHQAFIERERMANSDRERLELFAAYMVSESRLRRDRYSGAFAVMASDIFDLTRDMWRSHQQSPTFVESTTPKVDASPSIPPKVLPRRKESIDSADTSSPQSSRTNLTPRTESESPQSAASQSAGRENKAWNYHPVLSPIPSMAMSTAPEDEERSRGRSASRWWESDDGSVGGGQRIERSKRESKYMGLHREARLNLQWEDESSPSIVSLGTPGRAGPSNEYPPEKVGWHDENSSDNLPTPHYSVPNTPSATSGLDVSRLVTLPPPYPRHYPAMSNSHPDLASLRTTLRTLNDLSEVNEAKSTFEAKMSNRREVAAQDAASRTTQMRHNISEQVRLGQMSYSAAAAAEEAFQKTEAENDLAAFRREFDAYQPEVMNPLHALLSERITRATASISQLQDGLNNSEAELGPDAPMEEGDERPELLEKLKLLKWLVEARETLHREIFELESERDDRYRDLILADLKGRGEPESKLREATLFFGKDRVDRNAKFEREARGRMEELAASIDTHVSRGVEDQLSAFWDIAPGLLEIVKKIPESEARLEELPLSIPVKEIEENHGYAEFPLQYLHGLLGHAEKATYQFIENQVGLLCLLHEVGLCVMRAGLRVVEVDRCAAEGVEEGDEALKREMRELGQFEEERLTGELKDRVGVVEGQWKDALGGPLTGCMERVERVLTETGGWDESLKE